MGVKDLWTILAPVREECSLASLAGKRLAVDISGWVCQSCAAKSLSKAVEKPHLRTLFFRVHTLYCLGVSLVFIIDGEAVQLKWEEMDKREGRSGVIDVKGCEGRSGVIGVKGCEGRKTGLRTRLNCKIKECCELLDLLGVPHLQSRGEAEALCALLNSQGVVDGVLTQDNDAFLYGATVVYRDLTTNEKDPRVDCYRMEAVRETLALTHHDLVALSLLLGCDYCPQGVPGVGKEKALKLISSCRTGDPTCDLLQRFRAWRDGEDRDTPSTIEKQIQRKALAVPGFPNEKVIGEYLVPKDKVATDVTTTLKWKMPQISGVQSFCARHLGWLQEYAHTKTLPILTQWVMREGMQHERKSLKPESILRQRVRHGVPLYEVQWEEDRGSTIVQIDEGQGGGASTDAKGQRSHYDWITLEHTEQFEAGFPDLCAVFREQKEQAKRKKGPKKLKKTTPEVQENSELVPHPVTSNSDVGPKKQRKTTSEVQENSELVPHPVTRSGSNSDESVSEDDSEDDIPLLTRLGEKKVTAASQSRAPAKHPCAGIDTQKKSRVPAKHPCAGIDTQTKGKVAGRHPCAGIDTQTKGRVAASHSCASVDPRMLKTGKSPDHDITSPDQDITSFFRVTKPERDGKTSPRSAATEGATTQQTAYIESDLEDTSTLVDGTKDSVSDSLTVDRPKPPIKTTQDTSNAMCLDSSDEDDLPLFTRLKQKTTITERKSASQKWTAKSSVTTKTTHGSSAAAPIVID